MSAGEAFLLANARGVDCHERQSVPIETDINAVAGRPGHFRNDAAFILGEAIDESAFANVATSDDGQLHRHVAE